MNVTVRPTGACTTLIHMTILIDVSCISKITVMTMAYIKQKQFTVGVFPQRLKRGIRFNAYLRDYSPQWQGCCQHSVSAEFGWEAKEKAISEHKTKCVSYGNRNL